MWNYLFTLAVSLYSQIWSLWIYRRVTLMCQKSNRFRKATGREDCHKPFASLIYCNFRSSFKQTIFFCLFLTNFCAFKASCVNFEEVHWAKNSVFIFFSSSYLHKIVFLCYSLLCWMDSSFYNLYAFGHLKFS